MTDRDDCSHILRISRYSIILCHIYTLFVKKCPEFATPVCYRKDSPQGAQDNKTQGWDENVYSTDFFFIEFNKKILLLTITGFLSLHNLTEYSQR